MLDRAIVQDNRDPKGLGRLQVTIPAQTGSHRTGWIWPIVSSGFLVIPDPGEQVWVTYESGDANYPVWLGKISTTSAYRKDGRSLGSVRDLLERLSTAEEAVLALQQAVADLYATKADVGHTHTV